ncbi:hypothetical protein, partial [Candidatus Enterovibrio escicola]|uniref:hypothetical protein n=1 Tax=Candidatus Enterovibrio escicola TaxID=1927127 RepID=UPI001CC2CA8E
SYPRYDTYYYHLEIAKMLKCGSSENSFATYQYLGYGLMGNMKLTLVIRGKYYAWESMIKIGIPCFLG